MKNLYSPKYVWLALAVGVSTVIGATSANAVSVSVKPSKPILTFIRASGQSSKGNVDVDVVFLREIARAKLPVLQTQVMVGKKVCLVPRNQNWCTVKAVPTGKTYKILARSKNKNGFGPWSSAVSLVVKSGMSWSSYPASYSPVIPPRDPAQDAPASSSVRFDLSGAVGLALNKRVSSTSVRKQSTGSNLLVVMSSGLTRDAVILGTLSVRAFLIAPNNRLYVLFSGAVDFGNGASTCLLAQVYRDTGDAKCIENSNLSIDFGGLNAIQFDAEGNIYYSGYFYNSIYKTSVVRRYANGLATDYVNQYQDLEKFFVLPNGDILISGSTSSTHLGWTRRISTSGQVTPLTDYMAKAFWIFPDGNIYFSDFSSLRRYLPATAQLDPRCWIGCNRNDYTYDQGVDYSDHPSCCYGSMWVLANGSVFLFHNASLMSIYPIYKTATQSLKTITFGIPALTSALLVGTNKSGRNQMILYDSTNDSSTILVDGSSEIEFYHVSWNPAQNRVYFDGLRFSDNKYIIGYLDLATRQIVATDLLTKLTDFQTFSS